MNFFLLFISPCTESIEIFVLWWSVIYNCRVQLMIDDGHYNLWGICIDRWMRVWHVSQSALIVYPYKNLTSPTTYSVIYNLITRCVRWRDGIHVHFIILQILQSNSYHHNNAKRKSPSFTPWHQAGTWSNRHAEQEKRRKAKFGKPGWPGSTGKALSFDGRAGDETYSSLRSHALPW